MANLSLCLPRQILICPLPQLEEKALRLAAIRGDAAAVQRITQDIADNAEINVNAAVQVRRSAIYLGVCLDLISARLESWEDPLALRFSDRERRRWTSAPRNQGYRYQRH